VYYIQEKRKAAAKARGLDKLQLNEFKVFEIEKQKIAARNLEEAQEIYIEVYES
jgi:hypothetical protein